MLRVREDAIVEAVNRLLISKGYDAMTVDAVAAEVGVAKASLYKHFPSKEALACAAMVRVLQRTQAELDRLQALPEIDAIGRLRALVTWTLQAQLAGTMPSLPHQNMSLYGVLMADGGYLMALMGVSQRLSAWIEAAQAAGQLSNQLPTEVVLYTLFARACDPVLGLLRASGRYDEAQIVALIVQTCFDGLRPLS
jgi:TetR/AcrR family transcriptional regulator, regulator of autoinduction and epiphytic fitness